MRFDFHINFDHPLNANREDESHHAGTFLLNKKCYLKQVKKNYII
jgi:hypothetical protein